jgi:hypothetical protein
VVSSNRNSSPNISKASAHDFAVSHKNIGAHKSTRLKHRRWHCYLNSQIDFVVLTNHWVRTEYMNEIVLEITATAQTVFKNVDWSSDWGWISAKLIINDTYLCNEKTLTHDQSLHRQYGNEVFGLWTETKN